MWSHTLGDYIFIVIVMLHLQHPPGFIMSSYIDRNLAIKKLIYKRVTLATRTNDCLVVQRYISTRYRFHIVRTNVQILVVARGFREMGYQVRNPRFPHSLKKGL